MKKLLAVLLVLVFTVSMLTACGGKKDDKPEEEKSSAVDQKVDTDTKQNEVEPSEPQNTDSLSAPLPKLNTDAVDIYFTMEYSDGTEFGGSIVIIDNASPAKLYFSEHNSSEHVLYELADDGTITKQIYNRNDDKITKDTESSQQTLKEETDFLLNVLSNCGYNFTKINPGLTYRVCEEPDISMTLGAYLYASSNCTWYEALKDGEVVAYVAVNNQTGIFEATIASNYWFGIVIAETEKVEIPFFY